MSAQSGVQWSHQLHQAASNNDPATIQELLERGCPPDIPGGQVSWLRGASDMNTRTPLHYASKMGHLQCVRLLLKYGANPNAQDRDGYTPVHYVCQIHNPKGEEVGTAVRQCLLSLMEFGGSLKARTNSGRTSLDLAQQQKNTVCERELLRQGVQVETLLVLSRYAVSALIHRNILQPVHTLWIPESLKRYLQFEDILIKWTRNK